MVKLTLRKVGIVIFLIMRGKIMNNNDGIKPSRKYANGAVHETASGKFKVLDPI